MAQWLLLRKTMTNKSSKYGQITLVLVLASVFAMLLLPVSSGILDALLMFNIVATLTLLVFSISVSHSLQLYSFPTLLLICTLYRLGLNLSSTRLILAEGEAGDIIQTFGRTLTSGNLIVGLISFLVLQVIQFLVISKGAERVSEVSARFTLDALPGKQMSIDADLRAGLISNEDAQTQRKQLIQESKFYGSMDGAMKFVKGETIAGFLITAINILGGFMIGMLERNMSFGEAMQVYSLLTIGDGLASQIPALLLSLTAGILVTRVSNPAGNTSLGSEIGEQLFSDPKKIFYVAGGILILGFIPGFPRLLFVTAAGFLCVIAGFLWLQKKQEHAKELSIAKHTLVQDGSQIHYGQATPLLLQLSPDMYSKFEQDERWQICLNELFPKLKNMLSQKLGVPFPDLKIAVNEYLPEKRYGIQIFEVTVDEGFLSPEHCVIRNYSSNPDLESKQNVTTSETVHGTPIALLKLEHERQLQEQGVKAIPPEEMLLKHLAKRLKQHAHEFLGIQEVKNILTSVEQTHPELVKEVVPRMLTVHKLTEIVKRLVEEHVPIKDFRLILEVLSGCQPDTRDAVTLTELVRAGLARVICYQHTDRQKRLHAFNLSQPLDDEIKNHIHHESSGESYLHLAPERIHDIQQIIKNTYLTHKLAPKDVVVLTQPETRRFVKKIMSHVLPELTVLSYSELPSTLLLETHGVISETQNPGESQSQHLRLATEPL